MGRLSRGISPCRRRRTRPWWRRRPRSVRRGRLGADRAGRYCPLPGCAGLSRPPRGCARGVSRSRSGGEPELGGDHHLVTKRRHRAAEEFLPLSPAVHLGGVEESHAEIVRTTDRCDRFGVVAGSVPAQPSSQRSSAYFPLRIRIPACRTVWHDALGGIACGSMQSRHR